jgi:hypothetical protein
MMPKNDFTKYSQKSNFSSLEQPPYRLPIIQPKKNNMQQFSTLTIQTNLNYHRKMSMAFLNQYNDLSRGVSATIRIGDGFLPLDMDKRDARNALEKFLSDMSIFHKNELIRWEMIRDGIDPEAIVGSPFKM